MQWVTALSIVVRWGTKLVHDGIARMQVSLSLRAQIGTATARYSIFDALRIAVTLLCSNLLLHVATTSLMTIPVSGSAVSTNRDECIQHGAE